MNDSQPPTPPAKWRIALVASAFLAVALGLMIATWWDGRKIQLPDAQHEKLECASYTPSHNGHTLDATETRKLVVSDLRLLAERFRCVRTYSVSEGLDDVPKVARELGLKVMLGLWISSHGPSNDKEIAHGIALANRYSDVVTAVIVGNEVLLRRELTAAQLRALIERVRAGTTIPVTYADVWEFWLRNPKLTEVTSFVTIHILPYWEDHPIGIAHALDHVKNIYGKVQSAFPGQKIFIGETGWPSAGRPRLEAVPSLLNEARFIREFSAYAEHEKIPYNIIEAFDQPWKRGQEGTVGGYWGLYDAEGAAKFSFSGAISARPYWRIELAAALFGALLFAVSGWKLIKPRPTYRALALLGIAGHAAGSIAAAQWRYVSTANRTWLEWGATTAWSLSGWLLYLAVCVALVRWLDSAATVRRPANIATCIATLGYGSDSSAADGRLLGILRTLVFFGAAYVCLGLVYEGRGRDFPLAWIALPALGLASLEIAAFTQRRNSDNEPAPGNEEILFALCLAASALFVAWRETLANTRALTWSALCLLLSVSLITPWIANLRNARQRLQTIGTHPNERAEQQTGAA